MFWWLMKKKIFDCELVEWPLICRDLYQHRWMGGPDATPDLWKQPFSAVRASGGYPGNGNNWFEITVYFSVNRTPDNWNIAVLKRDIITTISQIRCIWDINMVLKIFLSSRGTRIDILVLATSQRDFMFTCWYYTRPLPKILLSPHKIVDCGCWLTVMFSFVHRMGIPSCADGGQSLVLNWPS